MMPGKKDCVKVVDEEGGRDLVQKRLLLSDLKEIDKASCLKYPDMKIGVSKFSKLRLRNCIFVEFTGTHNVCVCKIHQKINPKFVSLNDSLRESVNSQKYLIAL